MIAATLRHTAAPEANAKSEIHMAWLPLSVSFSPGSFVGTRQQRRTRPGVPGTIAFFSGNGILATLRDCGNCGIPSISAPIGEKRLKSGDFQQL
jgi:hypothetical protein